ncbi:glycine--tRNA ligase subunit alpha [Buchnera aphidicola]|uniref:glycine--tRNA ligase subunit alpha n=1 Tax=Buchnera aphidicola TaxID=9 RepID=UPI0034639252
MKTKNNFTCHNIILQLKNFWSKHGCIIIQPIDITVGAGTFHQCTFFQVIGKKFYKTAYLQISRRPTDGRYGENPNRLQQYYQFQVTMKPVPHNIQKLYLQSLQFIDINIENNDIRFIEDNWENPTLGACGLGWEIWLNGMEITQFTYFQKMGSLTCQPTAVEITYGIERTAMHIQKKKNIYDIIWDQNESYCLSYKQLFYKNEIEQSLYNFQHSNIKFLKKLFYEHLSESKRLLSFQKPLLLPAYEHILHATHNFNLLDARQIISNTERTNLILKIRSIVKIIAQYYHKDQSK